jgi:hypothetical protein
MDNNSSAHLGAMLCIDGNQITHTITVRDMRTGHNYQIQDS